MNKKQIPFHRGLNSLVFVFFLVAGFTSLVRSLGNGAAIPDFTITATPASQSVCLNGGDANYTVNVGQINSYSEPVTLAAVNTPPSTSSSFTINPVQPASPPAASTLTIGNITGNISGDYTIEIFGIAPTSTHTVTVQLAIYDTLQGIPTLTAPLNNATDIPLTPTLAWSSLSGAESYRVEIADDLIFSNIIYSADNIATTLHKPALTLYPLTTYYWRVRGNNVCGSSSYSDRSHFTTTDAKIHLPLVIK